MLSKCRNHHTRVHAISKLLSMTWGHGRKQILPAEILILLHQTGKFQHSPGKCLVISTFCMAITKSHRNLCSSGCLNICNFCTNLINYDTGDRNITKCTKGSRMWHSPETCSLGLFVWNHTFGLLRHAWEMKTNKHTTLLPN